jgi:hypothetical protein
MDGKLAPAPT